LCKIFIINNLYPYIFCVNDNDFFHTQHSEEIRSHLAEHSKEIRSHLEGHSKEIRSHLEGHSKEIRSDPAEHQLETLHKSGPQNQAKVQHVHEDENVLEGLDDVEKRVSRRECTIRRRHSVVSVQQMTMLCSMTSSSGGSADCFKSHHLFIYDFQLKLYYINVYHFIVKLINVKTKNNKFTFVEILFLCTNFIIGL
jgi:hypothetical protein